MTTSKVLFFYDGRINRRQFWKQGMPPLTMGHVLSALISILLGPVSPIFEIIGAVLLPCCLLFTVAAIHIKRLHDFGCSAWWFLPAIALGAAAAVFMYLAIGQIIPSQEVTLDPNTAIRLTLAAASLITSLWFLPAIALGATAAVFMYLATGQIIPSQEVTLDPNTAIRLTLAAASLITSLALGLRKGQQAENKYGPPPGQIPK